MFSVAKVKFPAKTAAILGLQLYKNKQESGTGVFL